MRLSPLLRRIPLVSTFLCAMLSAAFVPGGCGGSASRETDIPVTTAVHEARVLFLQGRDALDLAREEDARILFDRAIEADSAFALAFLYRGLVAGTPDEKRVFLDQATRHASEASLGERLLIGLHQAAMQNDLPRRDSFARRLREAYPQGSRALYEAAVVAAEEQRPYDARELLEISIDHNGLFVPALRAMARSYLFDDPVDAREAERYASRYVTLYPEEADAHILLGDVYRAQNQYEDARGEYTRAAMLDRDSYMAYIKRGHALTFIGLYVDARKDYARATELGHGAAKARAANYRTLTWIHDGDIPTAIKENEAVLHTLPLLGLDEHSDMQAYTALWESRFRMCLEAGRFDDATAALAQCTRLARALAERVEEQNYRRVSESEIALMEADLALARGEIVAARGHVDRAADFLRPIRSARKWEHTELLRARIALAEQQPARALEHLSEANQDLIQVKYHRALALDAMGRTEEARRMFEEVASWDFNDIEFALIRHKAEAHLHAG